MNTDRATDIIEVPREIKDRMADLRGAILESVIKILIDHNKLPHPSLVIQNVLTMTMQVSAQLLNETVINEAMLLERLKEKIDSGKYPYNRFGMI